MKFNEEDAYHGKNLIKFSLMDELLNFADADLERPPSSKTARSSSLIVSSPNSTRLVSEWLHNRRNTCSASENIGWKKIMLSQVLASNFWSNTHLKYVYHSSMHLRPDSKFDYLYQLIFGHDIIHHYFIIFVTELCLIFKSVVSNNCCQKLKVVFVSGIGMVPRNTWNPSFPFQSLKLLKWKNKKDQNYQKSGKISIFGSINV